MAAGKKTTKARSGHAEPTGQPDPRAPLDSAAFLAAARPVLRRLEEDLRARALASPAVTAALHARYEQEKQAQRTAESFAGWTAALATQVAVAWLLSCVFVRTLEDRGLLKQSRLAGPGAEDSQKQFFALAPSLTEREYLLIVFRELAHHPAAAALFDGEHSLVWRLSPSAEVARELLALFRSPSAAEPAFRFGQGSTRFLGDLYQDLSEEVRKRYALLQTPDFVEMYILDRTLEPAIARFGLDDTTLIDPTCGSGHFLLGAFDRLFEHRLRAAPGLDVRTAAVQALDCVYGADINPYAVAIARFRLTLSFLEKAGYRKLAEAPALPLHLVVADSLRINPQHAQQELWQQAGADAAKWVGAVFALEDERAAKDVLGRQYAAVVANPPYITVKDAAVREVYRGMYAAAAGKYALSAPFCERIFQLARPRGYTGQITANSFMKREFGKRLIEEVLPAVNLEGIVNTSGAYIPGHGTPTVLLFGTNEAPQGSDVLAVLSKRGEPSTPEDPSQGLVWRSVVEHGSELGFENDYLSVARVARDALAKHPWSLGGGGASELKELLEERAEKRLGELADSIGIASFTLEDDVYLRPRDAWIRAGCPEARLRPMVIGETIRDWSVEEGLTAFFPYDERFDVIEDETSELRLLWPHRTNLANNKLFGGKTKVQGGLRWYEFGRLTADKLRTPLTITFAFVATHNHFVLDRGGKVFKQSAPIIKLPEGATEDDHLALLAYLNSSTACFWMKQVCMNKGATSDRGVLQADEDKFRYEFDGTKLSQLPLPPFRYRKRLIALARQISELASTVTTADFEDAMSADDGLQVLWSRVEGRHEQAMRVSVALQEEIDWIVYEEFGLAKDCLGSDELAGSYDSSERPFLAKDRAPGELLQRRWRVTAESSELLILEVPEYKRRWYQSQGKFNASKVDADSRKLDAIESFYLSELESEVRRWNEPLPFTHLSAAFRSVIARLQEAMTLLDSEIEAIPWEVKMTKEAAVPFCAALRFTESGMGKFAEWSKTWEAQRAEDSGMSVQVSPPPKYAPTDYLDPAVGRLRGKLDVPKERFISYPGCESDQDGEPVYGWAGWDHLQRAQALASLYLKRKDGEGWTAARLTPMLAGLLELIPWVKQWHNEPSAEFGGLRMGDYYEQFLDGECRLHGLTHDDLRAWRPEKKARGGAAKAAKAASAAKARDTEGTEAPVAKKPRAGRKKAAAAAEPPPTPEAE